MKITYFLPFSFLLYLLSACSSEVPQSEWMKNFSPGTLGSIGNNLMNCPETIVETKIDELLMIDSHKIQVNDTIAVEWWKDNGYDFLNYHCITLRKRLFMVTINSEEDTKSSISIGAYYNRNKKKWIMAKDFSKDEIYRAKKSLNYLSHEIIGCL